MCRLQALVRVVDNGNGVVVDQSDAPFTITSADPVIIAISPSGDNFYPDDNTSIKWLSAFNGSNVKLEYYHNQSSTWHTISSSYPDHVGGVVSTEGTYSWTIPNNPGTVRVRVTDLVDISLNDQTGNSTINPYITVTSPNGESVTKCSSNSNFITWSLGNTSHTKRKVWTWFN